MVIAEITTIGSIKSEEGIDRHNRSGEQPQEG
jgi:hypothetical protein